jgi:hypothetical protein
MEGTVHDLQATSLLRCGLHTEEITASDGILLDPEKIFQNTL